MTTTQIIYRDPTELTVHPALKLVPEWSNDDPDFLALIDDVRERGVDYALLTVGDQIIDGRHRWRAAKRLEIAQVPTVARAESEVLSVVLNSLVQRRHLTKGALAYVSFPLLQPAYEEAQARKLEILKAGGEASGTECRMLDRGGIGGKKLGVGERLFRQAREVHVHFEKKPKLRAQFEPGILGGDLGLGAVIAGMAGVEATRDKPKQPDDQLDLFDDAFVVLSKRYKYWTKFDESQRHEARRSLRDSVKKMPADLRAEFKKAITAVEKEERA